MSCVSIYLSSSFSVITSIVSISFPRPYQSVKPVGSLRCMLLYSSLRCSSVSLTLTSFIMSRIATTSLLSLNNEAYCTHSCHRVAVYDNSSCINRGQTLEVAICRVCAQQSKADRVIIHGCSKNGSLLVIVALCLHCLINDCVCSLPCSVLYANVCV